MAFDHDAGKLLHVLAMAHDHHTLQLHHTFGRRRVGGLVQRDAREAVEGNDGGSGNGLEGDGGLHDGLLGVWVVWLLKICSR